MISWGNLSIQSKVLSAFCLVFIATLALGLFGMTQTGAVNNAAMEIRDNWLPSTSALGKLSTSVEIFRIRTSRIIIQALSGEPIDKGLFESAKADAQKAYKDYQHFISAGTDDERLMRQFDEAWTKALVTSAKVVEMIDKGDVKGSQTLYLGDDRKVFDEMRQALSADLAFNEAEGKKAADYGAATYANARWMTITALVVTALLCAGATIAIVVSVARPISRTIDVVNRLASGDRAITISDAERGDEIGTLARALKVFKENMIQAETLARAQEMERRAKEQRALALDTLVRQFEAKIALMVKSLAGAANEMQTTSNSMAAAAEQTNQQSSVVSAAAQQTSSNVQTVATATEELAASVREIGQQVANSRDIAQRALIQSDETSTTVESLSESARRIGDVVQLIASIASQTNLLALNATIEAARAGDAGKGFAVVASEVKSLATQTAKATGDIEGQITEIQNLTAKTVTAIEMISRTITEMSNIAIAIAGAVEEQGAATAEIARSASEAAKGTAEVTSNIESVRDASATTGGAASQILSSAAELSRQADDLNGEVDGFIAGVKAA